MPFPLLAGSLILGGIQTYAGLKGLSDLHNTPVPKYGETPEMKASRMRAEGLAKGGYSPEEKAAFEQKLSRSQNTGYQKGRDVAPGMAQELLAGLNYTNIGAQNDFAASDAQLHRQNIKYADSFAKELQDISNMNIQSQLQQRMAAEQALGGAVASGTGQLASALNLSQILGSDLYKGGGLGKTTGMPTEKTTATDMTGAPTKPSLEDFMKINVNPFQQGYEEPPLYNYWRPQ